MTTRAKAGWKSKSNQIEKKEGTRAEVHKWKAVFDNRNLEWSDIQE